MKFIKSKRGIALLAAAAAVAIAAIAAYAYFTASGSGSGTANVAGAPAALTVTQIGAGYDSLVPSNTYHQDQCFQCAGINEIGDNITLANPGAQQLVSVTVALRNWGGELTNFPITLSIDNTTNGPFTSTQNFTIAADQPNGRPTVTNVTFDLKSASPFVQQQFTYGISFDRNAAPSLNVALSSSTDNLAIGTDTNPGFINVNSHDPGLGNDFPTCATPITADTFVSVHADCGPEAAGNPGAYGTEAGNADIPAVEFDVVGGQVAGLYPGGPAQPVDYAITNPGSSSVFVSQVVSSVSGTSNVGCLTSWFTFDSGHTATSTETSIGTIAPGTTVFSPSGSSIQMENPNTSQDACENQTVSLAFAAS
jgi:hypothetical protein